MDDLPEPTLSSSSPNTNHRDTKRSRLTASRPNSPQTGLSSSEPFLRFPRPQGNRRLAHWISSSNPDMMHGSPDAEDSSLAESAFEIIPLVDVDLQDDQYTGSISESIGSLDFHRPDDNQSLTGTEHTYDDESIIDDDAEPLSRSMVQEEAVDVHNGTHVPLQEGSDESESEEEARSRCSLEYTQHSLKTPSILTPEASKILERLIDAGDKSDVLQEHASYGAKAMYDTTCQFLDRITGTVSAALPGFIFAATFTLIITLLYPSPITLVNNTMSAVTSIITATTTPVIIYTSRPSATAPPAQQTSTSRKGMGLIVLNDETSDEWLLGSKKPGVSFTPLGQGAIMVHVAADVTRAWLRKKDCLTITAERARSKVEMTYTPLNDGFLVEVPKYERHGIVKVLVQATCRPSVVQAVKVHFGKGIIDEAYELTKNFAFDISSFMPVAAHEAERCIVEAKKSFCAVSDTVATRVWTVSDSLLCRIKESTHKVHELLELQPWSLSKNAQNVISAVWEAICKQATESFKSIPTVEKNIREGILNAQVCLVRTQISARMWWLSVTGRKDERSTYGQKAKEYLERIRTKGRDRIRGLPLC